MNERDTNTSLASEGGAVSRLMKRRPGRAAGLRTPRLCGEDDNEQIHRRNGVDGPNAVRHRELVVAEVLCVSFLGPRILPVLATASERSRTAQVLICARAHAHPKH